MRGVVAACGVVAVVSFASSAQAFFCTVTNKTLAFKPDTMNRAISYLNEGRSPMAFVVTSVDVGVRLEVLKTLYGGQAYRVQIPGLMGGQEADIFAKDCGGEKTAKKTKKK